MKKLSILLLLITSFLSVYAQQTTKPKECDNPPAGYALGGDFDATPTWACFDGIVTGGAKIVLSNIRGINVSTTSYNFNYKGGNIITNASSVRDTMYNKEGVYWILQVGISGNNKVINCKAVEVIKTDIPEIDGFSCSTNSVTIQIKDTPNNRKHGSYTVDWGDNSLFQKVAVSSLPINISHTYSTIPVEGTTIFPAIVGYYQRSGFSVCSSLSVAFGLYTFSLKPYINKLEVDKINNQFNIEHRGLLNQPFKILAQEKGTSNWVQIAKTTSNKTIVRNLDLNKNYFFKLNYSEETCPNQYASDTVSTIFLNFEMPNKLVWTDLAKEISSFKNNQDLTYQLINNQSPSTYLFNSKQSNYSMTDNEFNRFASKNLQIVAKTKNVEIVSNAFFLLPLANEFSNPSLSINIYPNPSQEIIKFDTNYPIKSVEIIDLQGKIIESKAIEENQISILNLEKGKYILRLFNQENKMIGNKTIVKW